MIKVCPNDEYGQTNTGICEGYGEYPNPAEVLTNRPMAQKPGTLEVRQLGRSPIHHMREGCVQRLHKQTHRLFKVFKDSRMYMSSRTVTLERLKIKTKVAFYVNLMFYPFGIPFGSILGSSLKAKFIPNRIWRASDEI